MTLKKLISRIEAKEIDIKDKDDMVQIKKYFHDLPKIINKSLCQKIIKHWIVSKMKVSDDAGLDIVSKYLDIKGDYTTHKITVAGKYEFSYVEGISQYFLLIYYSLHNKNQMTSLLQMK